MISNISCLSNEDYSEDSILSTKEYLIFVSNAISDNEYREDDSKFYNLVILSIEWDEVRNYYCNTQRRRGDLIMYVANKFYEASNQSDAVNIEKIRNGIFNKK